MVEPLDLDKVNIFDNPMHMKIWGHMFSKACGSEKNNVNPNKQLLNKLTIKFIQDYNKHCGKNTDKHTP